MLCFVSFNVTRELLHCTLLAIRPALIPQSLAGSNRPVCGNHLPK